jgi:putative ABC transport system permease protein
MAIFHIRNQEVVGAGEKEFIALRIAAQDSKGWSTTLSSLEQLWKEHAGDAPFQYSFVDDAFAETFRTQQQFGSALSVLAVLALVIAGLGLLAMIVYTLEQRTKEIGIRKVSGASVWNILTLIASGYTRLVIAAFLIGAPVAWWIMNQWLEDFTYRITPSAWLFVAVGAGTLFTAVGITAYHSVKAALTNPVDVLKDE